MIAALCVLAVLAFLAAGYWLRRSTPLPSAFASVDPVADTDLDGQVLHLLDNRNEVRHEQHIHGRPRPELVNYGGRRYRYHITDRTGAHRYREL